MKLLFLNYNIDEQRSPCLFFPQRLTHGESRSHAFYFYLPQKLLNKYLINKYQRWWLGADAVDKMFVCYTPKWPQPSELEKDSGLRGASRGKKPVIFCALRWFYCSGTVHSVIFPSGDNFEGKKSTSNSLLKKTAASLFSAAGVFLAVIWYFKRKLLESCDHVPNSRHCILSFLG